MNDIEKAIELLEDEKRTVSMCLTSSGCAEHNKFINLAIQALQEKAEREKGCKYSTGENPESITICDGDEIFYVDYDKSFYNRDLNLDWISCPCCGRDLRKLVD